MAKAKKTAPKSSAAKSDSTVVRITAADETPKKEKKSAVIPAKIFKKQAGKGKRSFGVLGKFLGYFKGAWFELKQVHWPTRRATWGLTFAVLLFSAFFVVFILVIDGAFKYLFEIIYKQ